MRRGKPGLRSRRIRQRNPGTYFTSDRRTVRRAKVERALYAWGKNAASCCAFPVQSSLDCGDNCNCDRSRERERGHGYGRRPATAATESGVGADAGSRTGTTTGATKLVDRTYKWTNSSGADTGLLQSETREGTSLTYKYDTLDQLTSQSSTTYTLDKASNLTAAEGRTFTNNTAGQIASSGVVTYTHDGDGNQTTGSGGELTNTYSVTDQLNTATSRNAGTSTLTYDSVTQSQRSAISTVNGATTTNQLLENTAIGVTGILTNGARSDFVRDSGGGLIGQVTGAGESLYAVTDYQGSTIALVDSSQQVAAKYTYTPYGTTTATGRAAAGDPFRWIGGYQNTDNHGTYNLGFRQYDPKLGRFTQPDPSEQEANPYTYGLSNPAIFFDPTGLDGTNDYFSTVGIYTTAGAGLGGTIGCVATIAAGCIAGGGVGVVVGTVGGFATGVVKASEDAFSKYVYPG